MGTSNFAALALAGQRSRSTALPIRVPQRLASRGNVGGMKLRGGCERLHGRVIAKHEIQHMAEKMRVGGGRAQGLRTNPAFGQKRAQPLGVAGDEGKRLNCNDFSYFPGILNRLFQLMCLPFRNL
jgi:hypothetical protein